MVSWSSPGCYKPRKQQGKPKGCQILQTDCSSTKPSCETKHLASLQKILVMISLTVVSSINEKCAGYQFWLLHEWQWWWANSGNATNTMNILWHVLVQCLLIVQLSPTCLPRPTHRLCKINMAILHIKGNINLTIIYEYLQEQLTEIYLTRLLGNVKPNVANVIFSLFSENVYKTKTLTAKLREDRWEVSLLYTRNTVWAIIIRKDEKVYHWERHGVGSWLQQEKEWSGRREVV